MNIIIVGDGKVGHTLAEHLTEEEHNVVIIDNNAAILAHSQELLDVMVVAGNGASLETQKEAGVQTGDLLIAVTSEDEINLLCCILARKLGCKHTIARVRNPEYSQQMQLLREELGLSMTVNPERAAAHEIYKILQFPAFLKRDTFAKGLVELVELKISEESVLCGTTLEELSRKLKMHMLVCAVERGEDVTIPSGSFRLQAGDIITITAAAYELAALLKVLGLNPNRAHNVMLIGGSRTAVYLAQELIHSRISVKIIEENEARCHELSDLLPDALIIHGNGTNQELLREEGVEHTDAIVTLTGMDEENIIMSLFAKGLGVKKNITKINRSEYAPLFKDKGIDSVISPKLLTSNDILRYVRAMSNTSGGQVVTLHSIIENKAEALEFRIAEDAQYTDIPLMQLRLKPNILICCINRGGKIIIPRGSDVIKANDTVILVTTANRPIVAFKDIFLEDVRPNNELKVESRA